MGCVPDYLNAGTLMNDRLCGTCTMNLTQSHNREDSNFLSGTQSRCFKRLHQFRRWWLISIHPGALLARPHTNILIAIHTLPNLHSVLTSSHHMYMYKGVSPSGRVYLQQKPVCMTQTGYSLKTDYLWSRRVEGTIHQSQRISQQ